MHRSVLARRRSFQSTRPRTNAVEPATFERLAGYYERATLQEQATADLDASVRKTDRPSERAGQFIRVLSSVTLRQLLRAHIAETVGPDIEADVAHVVEMFTRDEPDDVADLAFVGLREQGRRATPARTVTRRFGSCSVLASSR